MKTIRMTKNFHYQPNKKVNAFIYYIEDAIYHRVPEFAVKAILEAKAGEIVE